MTDQPLLTVRALSVHFAIGCGTLFGHQNYWNAVTNVSRYVVAGPL